MKISWIKILPRFVREAILIDATAQLARIGEQDVARFRAAVLALLRRLLKLD